MMKYALGLAAIWTAVLAVDATAGAPSKYTKTSLTQTPTTPDELIASKPVLDTVPVMKTIYAIVILLVSPLVAAAQNAPTLVQQLTSYLAYETAETAEECPGGGCYHYYRAARLTKQLAAAIAAQNAGAPLTPIMNSKGIAPVWDINGHAIASAGTGVPSGTTPTLAPIPTPKPAATQALDENGAPAATVASLVAAAQNAPTLVQQLTSYLAYETAETAEECPGGGCYHYYRAARLTKQLAAAIAAQNAGAPLTPIMNSKGIAPVWDINGHAIASAGTGVPSGTTPTLAPIPTPKPAATQALDENGAPAATVASLAPTATASGSITLVQQLTANLAYQTQEAIEEPTQTYHKFAAQRLAKQLKAAIAAAAAGHPLPPIRKEDGTVAPIFGTVGGTTPTPLAPAPTLASAATPLPGGDSAPTTTAKAPTAVPSGSGSGSRSGGADGGSQSASADSGSGSASGEGSASAEGGAGSAGANKGSRSAGANGASSSAGADGGSPSANPDTGTPSSNPDTGAPSAEGSVR